MKYKILALFVPLIFFSCTGVNKPSGSYDFKQYQSIIDSEFKESLNRIKLRYSSFKIKENSIDFHNPDKDKGFFSFDFSSNLELLNNETFVAEINGDGFRDTMFVSGEEFKKSVIGRYVKKGKIEVKLFIRNYSDNDYPLFHIHTFSFDTPSIAVENKTIISDWLKGMDRINGYYGDFSSPYHDYLRMALPYKYTGTPGKYGYEFYDRGDSRNPSIVDILSGKTAIKETFQSGYRKNFLVNEPRQIPVESIEGINVKEMPFETMLKKEPQLFKGAGLVPHDNLYINIRTFSAAIEFLKFIKKRNIFPGALESDFRNFHTFEKIVNQMGLEPDNLEKLFGDSLVKNIAVTADDFFFNNGTGINIIYETDSPDLFIEKLKERSAGLTGKKDAGIKAENYGDDPIYSYELKDNSVSIHFVKKDGFIIVSNRLESLKRSLDCARDKIKSMDENYDLKYMRNIYRISDSTEDVFIFMSDPFIRKTLSPAWITGKMRRITVEEDLKMLASAVLFYKNDGNKSNPDIETLVRERYLVKEALLNDISDYYIDKDSSVPYSKSYGRIGFMKPISELSIKMVSRSEKKVYEEFLNYYSKFWEKFFDPIGISIKLGEKVEMKTTILPLIDNSIYGAVKEVIGGVPVKMNPAMTDDTIISFGLKLNNSKLTEGLEKTIERNSYYMRNRSTGPIFGNNIVVNFHDHDLRFLIDHKKILGNTRLFTRRKSDLYISLLGSLFNLPVSISLDIKNPARFKMENSLQKIMFSLNNTSIFRNNSINIYEIVPYKGQAIYSASLGFYYIKIPLFLAVINDKLVAATKVSIIEEMLAKRLARIKSGEKNEGIMANAFFHINSKGYNKILPQLKEMYREKALDVSRVSKKHYSSFINKDEKASYSNESIKYYGYDYTSLIGEKFYFDRLYPSGIRSDKTGFNSVPSEIEGEALRIFNQMTFNNTTINFSFTEHGIETRVVFDN